MLLGLQVGFDIKMVVPFIKVMLDVDQPLIPWALLNTAELHGGG